MKILLTVFLIIMHTTVSAQVLIFAKEGLKVDRMDVNLMSFIAQTLHVSNPALNLDCQIRVNEIKQERNFSDGVHIVEMLEVVYTSRLFGSPDQKIYFPIGTKVTRDIKNSKFSGTVEEIQLEADDIVNSRFIFQHNGMKEIVWMTYEDDHKTVPCRLKP
ncbi:MAG: hypothetical protein ABL930_04330 [Pseudobdellovibrio sp.]